MAKKTIVEVKEEKVKEEKVLIPEYKNSDQIEMEVPANWAQFKTYFFNSTAFRYILSKASEDQIYSLSNAIQDGERDKITEKDFLGIITELGLEFGLMKNSSVYGLVIQPPSPISQLFCFCTTV